MSATNRGGLSRARGDFYSTPSWAVDLLVKELGLDASYAGYVVDPGSGSGAISHRLAEILPLADIRGIEADEQLCEVARAVASDTCIFEHADFLSWRPDGEIDLVIGNPPYGQRLVDGASIQDRMTAEMFVRHALEIAPRRATVAMLMRVGFAATRSRRDLRTAHPFDLFLLESRPSFNGSGTDACDYAWFVWGPRRGGRFQVLGRDEKT